jgi:hypothetical protein
MEVGDQFAGYRIESLVGRGGMGVVYRATQLDLGRAVALKVIAPEALEDEAARARFVSEARHAASIDDPNIVPIFAAGEAEGMAYFAMRFVEGDDLRTRVRRDGPLAPPGAAAILQSAAAALDAIHRAGLVHRDVKPANILLGAGDHVYLTDFGLARQILARGGTATGAGRWAGSLHYAAPEQIRGGRVDARADIYALGGVLVFMLTGRVPFDRDTDEAVLWAHVGEPPPRPSELRPGVPRAFDEVVQRAMAKLPADRYASAGDLGRAARAAAEGRRAPQPAGTVARGAASPTGAIAVAGLSDDAPTVTAARYHAAVPAIRPWWRSPLYITGATAAIGLFVAGAIATAIRGHHPDGGALEAGTPPPATTTPSPTASPSPVAPPSFPRVALTFRDVVHRPNAVARVGSELWVTSASQPLVRLDAMTGARLGGVAAVPAGGKAISVRGDRVWVANTRQKQAVCLSAATREVLARARLSGPAVDIAADASGGAWVALHGPRRDGPDTVAHYDESGRLLRSVTIQPGVSSIALGGDALWVAALRVAKIVRIDPASGAKTNWARLVLAAYGLAYGGGYLWAGSPNDDAVYRVDPRVRDSAAWRSAGRRPEQLAYAAGRLFVASSNGQSLLVLDPRTLKPAHAPLPMPLDPFAVTADARHVWVTGIGENTVTRIDLS